MADEQKFITRDEAKVYAGVAVLISLALSFAFTVILGQSQMDLNRADLALDKQFSETLLDHEARLSVLETTHFDRVETGVTYCLYVNSSISGESNKSCSCAPSSWAEGETYGKMTDLGNGTCVVPVFKPNVYIRTSRPIVSVNLSEGCGDFDNKIDKASGSCYEVR